MGPSLFADFLDFYKRRLNNKYAVKSKNEDVESQEMKVTKKSKSKLKKPKRKRKDSE